MKRKNYIACLEILTLLVELRVQIPSYAQYPISKSTLQDLEESLILHASQVRKYIEQVPMVIADDEVEPVRIAVIGAFSSGKSTLINALLDEEVNPTNISVTTASITEFRYARESKIFMGDVTQRDVPDDKLTRVNHIKFTRLVQHQHKKSANAKQHYFRYYLDRSILKDITLIDTPGFQSVGTTTGGDTKLTKSVAKQADAFLVLGDMNKGNLDLHAIEQIKDIKKYNPAPAFLFLNKADVKNNPRDREDILRESLRATGDIFVEGHTISAKTLNELNEMRSKIDELTRLETSSAFTIEGIPRGTSRYIVEIKSDSGKDVSYRLRQNPENAINSRRLREIFFQHVKPKAQKHAEDKKTMLRFPFTSVRQAYTSILPVHGEIRKLADSRAKGDRDYKLNLRKEAARIERQLEKLRITLEELEEELQKTDETNLF